MKTFVPGALAGLGAALLLAAPALAGPTVTVRVEGQSTTLLERTTVTLPDTDSPICTGKKWTVADALESATAGNWDRQPQVNTIMGETHSFADSDYWALWNGSGGAYRFSTAGVCDQVMADGEEALFLVDRSPPPDFAPTSFPLALRGLPSAVQTGTPVSVSVVSFALDGAATPVADATVSGGGATASTGASGTAVLTFTSPGPVVVKASKAGRVATAGERVAVSATPPALPASGPDRTAPTATLSGIERGQVFKRKRAPRTLRGTVSADPSGIKSVRLSIVRKLGGRCWAFDGAGERFKPHRCGGSRSFRIGDRAEWSYLLPQRLPRGRYTIRVVAIDNAGNDSATETEIRVK
ncbi:MAG TPA: hypothetical protein VK631_06085 [Solirubrobacteraceae bacterium]|nr:hypothetical protein [Solirubrobacteraceae bacterium]